MTPEYTPEAIAMIVRCLRVQVEGPGPICPVCVHQTGLVAYDEQSGNQITAAGHFVLALAAERDLLKLRCEWQEARAEELLATDGVDDVVANEGPSAVVRQAIAWAEACARKTEAARAAYVAAGGVV